MKRLKTETITQAVALLRDARLTNVESVADKYAIIKTLQSLKAVAEAYDDFEHEMLNKLKGKDHDAKVAKFRQMQIEEMRIKRGELRAYTLPIDELIKTADYIKAYDKAVADGLKPEAEKLVDADIRTISEQSIAQLIASNDWTASDSLLIDTLFCEQ